MWDFPLDQNLWILKWALVSEALVFRDATLISKLVLSSEVWYGDKKQEYKKLEIIDEMFYMFYVL